MTAVNYKLVLPSNQNEVSNVETFIEECAIKHKLSDDLHGTLAIVITELFNNAVIHGNKLDKSKKVELTIEITKTELIAKIKDEGFEFDEKNLPDPRKQENLSKSCGRGVFIARNMMDQIQYTQSNSGLIVSTKIKLDFA